MSTSSQLFPKKRSCKMENFINSLSSSKAVFEASIPPYQNALDQARYKYKLNYQPEIFNAIGQNPKKTKNNKKTRRDIIWYNPPSMLGSRFQLANYFYKQWMNASPRATH